MPFFRLLLAALAFLPTGCNQQALFDKLVPQEEVALSKQLIAQLAAGDFPAIEQQLDPSLNDPAIRGKLQQLAAQFPSSPLIEAQLVGAHSFTSGSAPQRAQYSLTLQYAYPGKWLLANVVLNKQDGRHTLLGLHVNPLPDSLQNINRFTFAGKGATHFIMFTLAIAVPVFILVALVLCIRTPMPRRKWLWIVFILFGFMRLSLNWTDGSMNFSPLSVQLFGVMFGWAGPVAPLVLAVSIPLGAVMFLVRRSHWLAQARGTS
jgi:hypothetical protein